MGFPHFAKTALNIRPNRSTGGGIRNHDPSLMKRGNAHNPKGNDRTGTDGYHTILGELAYAQAVTGDCYNGGSQRNGEMKRIPTHATHHTTSGSQAQAFVKPICSSNRVDADRGGRPAHRGTVHQPTRRVRPVRRRGHGRPVQRGHAEAVAIETATRHSPFRDDPSLLAHSLNPGSFRAVFRGKTLTRTGAAPQFVCFSTVA